MKKSLLAFVASVMVLGAAVDAKTLKFQISSKSGDWAHNYLTEN